MTSDLTARRFFLFLLIAATVLLGAMIRPIANSLIVAAVLVGVLWPLHQKLVKHMRNRRAPSAAAALLVFGILILMLVPLAGLSAFVVNEGEQGMKFISDTLRSERVNEWIERLPVHLREGAADGLAHLPRPEVAKAAAAGWVAVTETGQFVFQAGLMLIALFFLLIQGDELVRWLDHVLPLKRGQTRELLAEVKAVSYSLVVSTIITAAVQAAAALVGFFIARVPHPVFFAVVTFFCAFIPAIGGAAVCLVVALILLVTGHPYMAVFLSIWGLLVVGLVDNAVKPLIRTINEVLGPDVGAQFMEMLRVIFTEQRPVRHEYPLEVMGGALWFAAEGFPARDGQAAVLLVQDITDRKQMEAQLGESERLAAIGLLAGGIGHEINNPLAWVMTHIRTMQSEVNERARSGDSACTRWSAQLDEVMQGADRIRQIVRDLAFFTRGPETDSKPIDVRGALDWAAEMAMSEMRHRACLTKHYLPAPLVAAPDARLGQVFLNLLINAAQSIPDGQIEANEVRLELSTDEQGRARVDVHDTGTGISPENVPRLFEPFFTTKPPGVGTGLGLSVSWRIVQSLGGSLELVSAHPGDTRFRVTLPAAPDGLPVPECGSRAPAKLARRLQVMVIDDQPSFLLSLRLAMQKLVEIHGESSALLALDRLRAGERFDAVVCDLMMPDLCGMDFHEKLSSDVPCMLPKVIYMTAGAFTPRARAFLSRVQNPCIEKPFLPEQLVELLARL